MFQPSRQAVVIGCLLLAAAAGAFVLSDRTKSRVIDAAFWFEPVTYDETEVMVDRLGGPITMAELATIEAIATVEITRAFTGLRIAFSGRRDATYSVRVEQELRHVRGPWTPGPAGESRAIAGLGGSGAVNFRLLANRAIGYASADATRPAIIAAIGRGIGRAAVHEFAHQLLGAASIHDTADVGSYEYHSADRREQYYSEMRWSVAWPLLEKRVGLQAP